MANVKSCECFKDSNGKFYLKLVYTYTDDYGLHEVIYPKVSLPIPQDVLPIHFTDAYFSDGSLAGEKVYFGIEQDGMRIHKAHVDGIKYDVYYADRTVEPAVHKMTIEEIEKKLGYKVEIVSKKK